MSKGYINGLSDEANVCFNQIRSVIKSGNGFEVDVCRCSSRKVYGDNRISNMCEDVTFTLYANCAGLSEEGLADFGDAFPRLIEMYGDEYADTLVKIAEVSGRLYHMNSGCDLEVPLKARIEMSGKVYEGDDNTAFLCADAMHTHTFGRSLIEAAREMDNCSASVLYVEDIKIPDIFCGLGVASYIFANIHTFCAVGHIDAYGIFGMVYGDGNGYSRMSKAAYNNGFNLAPMKDYGFTVYCSYADMEEVFEEMRENYEQALIEEGEEELDDSDDEEDFDEDACCDWDCINCPRCATCDCADDCDCDCDDDCENCSCEDDCDDCECCDGCEYEETCKQLGIDKLPCDCEDDDDDFECDEDCECGVNCKGCGCDDPDAEFDEDEPYNNCGENCECHKCKGCCDEDDDIEIEIHVQNSSNCGGCGGCATKVSDNEADGSCYDCQNVGLCECNLIGFSTCHKLHIKQNKKSK